MIKRPVLSRSTSLTALLRPLRVTADPHGKPGMSNTTLKAVAEHQSSPLAIPLNVYTEICSSKYQDPNTLPYLEDAHGALQDSRSYPTDPGLAYSTSWPPYDSSSLLSAGTDPVNLTLPGPSSEFHFYPSAFGTSPFQLPDTTYPTPPPTGSVAFESTFQHEFFVPAPPPDAPNPFLLDTPKLRSEGVSSGARHNSLAIRSRAASQPQLRTQLSIPSPFPAYRSIQSFPVNLHHNRHASSSSPTDEVQPSIRRMSNDQANRSNTTLSEVIVPTEEESTAFISKLYQ